VQRLSAEYGREVVVQGVDGCPYVE
jgi:hypothetical protein